MEWTYFWFKVLIMLYLIISGLKWKLGLILKSFYTHEKNLPFPSKIQIEWIAESLFVIDKGYVCY